ncbi:MULTISPECIES: acyl-CoA dehydrogenase family protein [Rhizobium]|uniref:Acyl-CoA dehydrogenase family protein n=1 Tax=Rhizobium rhododendri TaxID=2506430 RepID=A0ABY8IDR2_9HYPH|nr:MULTISPECIES: acyl-CoA dehydrogenase family protein [Rhizobium]MBZ5758960.1 acyl-CoA dehydrogenase family protein [Rhizobium sp. VS19-DR96]MBZ5764210.1 acyl-CoA dehydrogenase family protein [Rhizobium sp. VS19-DR129.2]MBZ5771753.1 acyl-CoA dehydrogenase family protein [Rhizobium sp. VS19-DRK62.2]MBZ5783560.1 acyl-CoA dehydrogenase family protein [Rhizobium sp. VS19-DR121]MBZ5801766.1 acyl-CoA dehydrogenase family protein [Rhizobium sp. VS19-DR181]
MQPVATLKGPTRDHLDWPFFDARHRQFAERLDAFAASTPMAAIDHSDVDGACRKLVRALGDAGLLEAAVGAPDDPTPIDSRSVCLARETLAWHDGLADFAFAMQGLGTGAIGLSGSGELRSAVLPKVRSGEWLAAFALSEKDAGSDVAAMSCAARLEGDHYILDDEKTWISNGGIADVYTVFARTGEAPGTRGISAFVVFADDPGFSVTERIEVIAPHPLATIRFDACRIPASRRLGSPGEGFKIAMRTLDIFRASVAAAALGFARRALDETLVHVQERPMFGARLADLQLTQAALGDMATGIDAAALLTYRAAWRRDVQQLPTTREAAMAKMTATETAQVVIDRAVQLFGGRGVKTGEITEKLYREIRALRIYEGATEVQKLIVARELLKSK